MDQECKDCNIKYDLLKKTLEPLKREKDIYSMLALETKINKKWLFNNNINNNIK